MRRDNIFSLTVSTAQRYGRFSCSRLNINPLVLFEDELRWLRNPAPDEFVKLIVKIVYQAALYSIWKERNARIHNQISRPAQAVILEMKQIIQVRRSAVKIQQV